jgi:DNA-binding MarR family transcriptional regulator
MADSSQGEEAANTRIVLGLLESVERNGDQSQRELAAGLGIALGLCNAYLKRCVTKGLVKMRAVPTRRYAYYLTPKGFAEKSRLTVDYLSSSFSFFRRARADCSATLKAVTARGWRKIALVGVSDLAEIATICALESKMTIVAVIDTQSQLTTFVGLPVLASFDAIDSDIDAVVVTDLGSTEAAVAAAVKKFGAPRVFVPALLGVNTSSEKDAAE